MDKAQVLPGQSLANTRTIDNSQVQLANKNNGEAA